MKTSESDNGVELWDLPTRVFHWVLVVAIALQFASGEFGWLPMRWHYLVGYTTLALIGFRISWGFVGSQTSRFGNFLRGPRVVFRYLSDSLRGRETRSDGHNPLGGWSVVAMIACVTVQAASGLFASDDLTEEGPLTERVSDATVDWMTRIHHINRYVLLTLIVLHIGAVLAHWLYRNQNLVSPMLHGRASIEKMPAPRVVSSWRALGLFAISAAIVWAIVEWGNAA